MTLAEYEALSDAERTRLIGESVMGWRYVGPIDETERDYFETTWDASSVGGSKEAPRRIHCRRFRPLFLDADACAVLDRMVELGWWYSEGWCADTQYVAAFFRPGNAVSGSAQSDTRPKAISLAAAIAVGAVE